MLAADDLASLARRDGRFVIVEGVVRRIGLGRARLYLDLGGRGALSVVASRKTQAAFQAAGAPLTALAGEKIRVRGALDSRFGPQLEIVDPLMLERLGRAEAKIGNRTGRMRVWAGETEMRRGGPGAALRARALAALRRRAGAARSPPALRSIRRRIPPRPASSPTAAPQTTGGAETNPERKRLIDAFGGEYSAPAVERYLNDVLARLAQQSDTPSEPYRVTILDSPVVNAFALPTGEIFITRGLLTLANDTSEVAAVMAHEIAHVTQRHAAQRAELEKTAALFTRVSNQVLDRPQEGEAVQARMQLSIARFSRQQEFEADQIGIGVIAKAGYDPYAASRFLTSLGRWSALRTAMIGAGSADKPDMMATHPSTPERVAQAVVEAQKFSAPGVGETDRDAYLNAVDGIAYGDNPAQGLVRGTRFLHPKLGFAFEAPDGFTLENQSAALIGVGEGGAQALRLDIDRAQPVDLARGRARLGLDRRGQDLVDRDAAGRRLSDGDRRRPGRPVELPARRGPGRRPRVPADLRRAFAHPRGRRALPRRDPLVPPAAAGGGDGGAAFAAAGWSTAQAGDTAASMAQRMSPEERAVGQFLVLNGLDREGPLVAGQRYKIIAP